MKKNHYIFLDLLTIAFLMEDMRSNFYRKKLGCSGGWELSEYTASEETCFDIVKYITVAAAVVLIVLIIVGYRKKKELLGKTDL